MPPSINYPTPSHTLLLARNNIPSVDMREVCSNIRDVTTISLQHNSITHIGREDFLGCSELEELDLSYNNIATITQHSLAGLDKLKKLKILGNFIICFDKTFLDKFTYVPVIEIDLRYLECNCQSKWMLEW